MGTEMESYEERLPQRPRGTGGRNQYAARLEPLPTRIVCLGGGTGLPRILRGLSRRALPKLGEPGLDITAIVAMSDDGGSSGKLRRLRGLLPPGDVRNCLVALAGGQSPLSEVFQYRFDGGGRRGIGGHAVGNLLIAALTELRGDFCEAVQVSARLLGARGRVLPSTTTPVELVAHMEDGTRVKGERRICRARKKIVRVELYPERPKAAPGVLEAIERADLITLGPGSLYSSVLPNLLVEGVTEALQRTRALKVLVANMMTQPGETDGMSCLDHVQAVIQHIGPVVDVVLINGKCPDEALLERYARKGSHPVKLDRRALIEAGVIPVEADLLKEGERIRHDSRKVSRCLLALARRGL